jgi:hypothetical protein
MSNGDQPTDLRAYAGSITRDRPVLELHAGVMAGRVVITPLSGFRGAGYRATRFEVAAHWHGPGLEGLPPAADADVTDTLLLGDLELARAVAMAAIDELRASRVPDLRALRRRFDGAE